LEKYQGSYRPSQAIARLGTNPAWWKFVDEPDDINTQANSHRILTNTIAARMTVT